MATSSRPGRDAAELVGSLRPYRSSPSRANSYTTTRSTAAASSSAVIRRSTALRYRNSSPGAAPEKAYAAAFVLLLIVVALNFTVDLIARRGSQTGLESTRLGA